LSEDHAFRLAAEDVVLKITARDGLRIMASSRLCIFKRRLSLACNNDGERVQLLQVQVKPKNCSRNLFLALDGPP
jgi:hypothetical protein